MAVTVCDTVVEQPFEGSVTTNVYVPAALTEGFADEEAKPEGPLHAYVTPLVADEPLRLAEGEVQVIVCAAPAVASGAPALGFITCCAVAVQPFAGSVTVSVYVPAEVTVGFCTDELNPAGPLQL